ncbi:DUF2071 domain-containing protein [Chitinophaga sedimenti]|uniref:DUF2071 domain-containing protein n=1 Tax=Chitinophaga sedimenti TaxID=2033606 RepID=UPI0020035892|nr:DUF2071 domain-containing protein [Chitinophaga sedimenti]MCK7555465.1 DUF2071 domain-containing protein [Chitinophaga sedimenti]
MKLPVLHGVIDRRLLVNFAADPEVVARLIPAPFQPKLHRGKAIVGVCLIRLKQIRPKGFPGFMGISSENGAHRFAVEWEENGVIKEGVYIPRRDTSLRLNTWAGGRVFPGTHYLAKFEVKEGRGKYQVAFQSSDHTRIAVDAEEATTLNADSVFGSLDDVSCFFERGSIGYSPNGQRFEECSCAPRSGKCSHWR